jgi:hypothetical protein
MLRLPHDSRRIQKWAKYSGKETSAYQEHFNDLCALLGQPSPVSADPTGSESFCFQKRVLKDAELFTVDDGPNYTPTTCFDPFPYPAPVGRQEQTIAALANELNELRENWLNPPEWTTTRVLEFPGSVDGPWSRFVHEPDTRGIGTVSYPRIEPRDEECAAKLKKRTLTNLYNERPAWLAHAHAKLDAAVAAAYGWAADLSDEEILERLLALNLERAAEEKRASNATSRKRSSRARTADEMI